MPVNGFANSDIEFGVAGRSGAARDDPSPQLHRAFQNASSRIRSGSMRQQFPKARGLSALWPWLGLVAALVWPTFGHAAGPSTDSWEKVQRVFDEIRARYPGRIDQNAMANRAIQSMLQGLDPYSTLLDENAYGVFQQDVRGNYVGLGLEVELDQDALTILSSMEGTPAYQADLRAGDRITTLDGVSVAGLSLEQALHLAHGEIDSNLLLTVLRAGENAPRTVTVRRTLVPRANVRDRWLQHGFAYVRIEHFDQSTPPLVMRALSRLGDTAGSKVAGLVMDLRGNPGGSVRAAVAISAAFLPEHSLVVSMEGPSIGDDAQLFAQSNDAAQSAASDAAISARAFAKTVPMVVLVDGGSASAAEILAGALQDHRRALLIGSRTFGKGTVQSIVPLGDGTALKLTVARYLTPSGRAIQGLGIEPDARIDAKRGDRASDVPEDVQADLQLAEALRILVLTVSGSGERSTAAVHTSAMDSGPLPAAQPASLSRSVR